MFLLFFGVFEVFRVCECVFFVFVCACFRFWVVLRFLGFRFLFFKGCCLFLGLLGFWGFVEVFEVFEV